MHLIGFRIEGWYVDDGNRLATIVGILAQEGMHIEVLFREYEPTDQPNENHNGGQVKGEYYPEIPVNENNALPTGDGINFVIYIGLVIVAVVGMTVAFRYRNIKNGKRFK